MKTLLAYATKSGASETCANTIAERLGDCDVVDIGKNTPDLSRYDRVILGGGVRIGRAYRPMRSFMKKNLADLQKLPVWIYFCNIDVEGFPKMVDKNVPEELRKSAKSITSLGGKPPRASSDLETNDWLNAASLEEFVKSLDA